MWNLNWTQWPTACEFGDCKQHWTEEEGVCFSPFVHFVNVTSMYFVYWCTEFSSHKTSRLVVQGFISPLSSSTGGDKLLKYHYYHYCFYTNHKAEWRQTCYDSLRGLRPPRREKPLQQSGRVAGRRRGSSSSSPVSPPSALHVNNSISPAAQGTGQKCSCQTWI